VGRSVVRQLRVFTGLVTRPGGSTGVGLLGVGFVVALLVTWVSVLASGCSSSDPEQVVEATTTPSVTASSLPAATTTTLPEVLDPTFTIPEEEHEFYHELENLDDVAKLERVRASVTAGAVVNGLELDEAIMGWADEKWIEVAQEACARAGDSDTPSDLELALAVMAIGEGLTDTEEAPTLTYGTMIGALVVAYCHDDVIRLGMLGH